MSFEDLSGDDKKKLYEYNFVIRLLPDIPEEEVRAIFQRLSKNTMVLTAQELRHATYWGPFIRAFFIIPSRLTLPQKQLLKGYP